MQIGIYKKVTYKGKTLKHLKYEHAKRTSSLDEAINEIF